MERERGISITSAALQFSYRGTVVNLLDTPGHADFSEDTYRVLTAVDAAVMLVDAAKGLEAQTMKLFAVCRHRGIPVITVVNKWDRPGLDALALMDEVAERTGLAPTPLTWPVGIAGNILLFTVFLGGVFHTPQDLDLYGQAGRQVRVAVEEVVGLVGSLIDCMPTKRPITKRPIQSKMPGGLSGWGLSWRQACMPYITIKTDGIGRNGAHCRWR